MNVLQVTFRDLVGRRFNGYDLHRSLVARGHDSSMLVVQKRSDDPRVHHFSKAGEMLERGLYAAERVSSLQGLLSPFALTFPLRGCVRAAKVVHWHLTYPHYVSTPLIPFAARLRPTVWTLHDPWAMTGHCVHPLDCERWKTGCGKCPDLSRSFAVWFDTTAFTWRIKRRAFAAAPLTLVVASPWMRRMVAASPLLSGMPCHVIPFGLDLNTWRPRDRAACRVKLGIPPGAKVVAFRVPEGHRQRQLKGIPWLVEALLKLRLPEPATLLLLEGRGALDSLAERYRLVETGWLDEDERLAEALAAADLFIMPSAAESFGMMALEAMACGTPVITTAGTAVADTIHAPAAGKAVRHRDAEALADTIAHLLAHDDERAAMGTAGRRIVEAEHSYSDYVRRHEELYAGLLEDSARPSTPLRRIGWQGALGE